MEGAARTFQPEIRSRVLKLIEEVARGTAATLRGEAVFSMNLAARLE